MGSFILKSQSKDLGGFSVRRVLPQSECRSVGPYVFFDHMGPAEFSKGQGVDVNPHPHIGLATITYLYEGSLQHRDSLGNSVAIRPHQINWMTAGKGIVHSERSPRAERLKSSHRLHGIQSWVALPADQEEMEPSFQHYGSEDLSRWVENGLEFSLAVGEWGVRKSAVKTSSPLFQISIRVLESQDWLPPKLASEWALYISEGEMWWNDQKLKRGDMFVSQDSESGSLQLKAGSLLHWIGGEPVGSRFLSWNFVATSQERVDRAMNQWKSGLFAKVPGDDGERNPEAID
jgi:redox-sensitive bicupin YhaK (pirin superfamily)